MRGRTQRGGSSTGGGGCCGCCGSCDCRGLGESCCCCCGSGSGWWWCCCRAGSSSSGLASLSIALAGSHFTGFPVQSRGCGPSSFIAMSRKFEIHNSWHALSTGSAWRSSEVFCVDEGNGIPRSSRDVFREHEETNTPAADAEAGAANATPGA